MNDLRLALNKQLDKLASERDLIDVAIEEIQRRYGVLDDVESWGLLADADEFPPVFESSVSEAEAEADDDELELVNAELDDDFELEVAAASGEDRATGADGFGLRPRDLFKSSARQA